MKTERLLVAPWINKQGEQVWRLLYLGNWWTRVIAQDRNAERVFRCADQLVRVLKLVREKAQEEGE